MEKQNRTKKDIVKMLLKNKELENEDETQLMEILFDEQIAIDVDKQAEENETWSDKLADKITEVGCEISGKSYVEGSSAGEGYCEGEESKLLN